MSKQLQILLIMEVMYLWLEVQMLVSIDMIALNWIILKWDVYCVYCTIWSLNFYCVIVGLAVAGERENLEKEGIEGISWEV